MITFHNPFHQGHAPVHEFFRGERVPCFEKPARVDYVEEALRARGHGLMAPDVDSAHVLSQVHAPRYLAFLQTAWQQWLALDPANVGLQPFPSVWPVRTLRSDVEPENFVARLGLYSMDNGTPMAFGTWTAAKAGADAAASAATQVAQGARAACGVARCGLPPRQRHTKHLLRPGRCAVHQHPWRSPHRVPVLSGPCGRNRGGRGRGIQFEPTPACRHRCDDLVRCAGKRLCAYCQPGCRRPGGIPRARYL